VFFCPINGSAVFDSAIDVKLIDIIGITMGGAISKHSEPTTVNPRVVFIKVLIRDVQIIFIIKNALIRFFNHLHFFAT
jgi:hypothetical protein